jgi:hypothetical protein
MANLVLQWNQWNWPEYANTDSAHMELQASLMKQLKVFDRKPTGLLSTSQMDSSYLVDLSTSFQ